MAFELGLLWPRYMELTGAVVGHFFALEGYAFFIEAIFIGLYLHGWDRLSPRAHWWCGVVIAFSGILSGVLVLGVNAWMQLPVGFRLEAGRVVVTDPIAVFKRPIWFYMALHSTLSCYIAVAFAVAAVYAAARLRGRQDAYTRSAILVAMSVGAASAVVQPLSGDLLSKFVFQTQKAKFAAMEGQFRTQRSAPLRIGGLPDAEAQETRWAIEIPGGLSFLATHDPRAEVPGLDQVPRSDWPNVELTHLAFQVMVGLGMALVGLSIWFWWSYRRRRENCALESGVAPGHRALWPTRLHCPGSGMGRDRSRTSALGHPRDPADERGRDPGRGRHGDFLRLRAALSGARNDRRAPGLEPPLGRPRGGPGPTGGPGRRGAIGG